MEYKEWVMPTHIVAAAGVVINDNEEILLVNTYNSGWVFPGGQVEVGENIIDGVKREVLEETGVEVEVGEVFCISSNTAKHPGYNRVKEIPTKVVFDIICKAKNGEPRPSVENSESLFVPKDKVLEFVKTPAIVERYKAFLEYNGRPMYLEYRTGEEFELRLKMRV